MINILPNFNQYLRKKKTFIKKFCHFFPEILVWWMAEGAAAGRVVPVPAFSSSCFFLTSVVQSEILVDHFQSIGWGISKKQHNLA